MANTEGSGCEITMASPSDDPIARGKYCLMCPQLKPHAHVLRQAVGMHADFNHHQAWPTEAAKFTIQGSFEKAGTSALMHQPPPW